MKIVKLTSALFLTFFLAGTIVSCGSGTSNTTSTEEVDKQDKAHTSMYICPMHCKGSGSDNPGKCPVCGMDYKKNEKYKAEDQNQPVEDHEGHDHSHDGHNH